MQQALSWYCFKWSALITSSLFKRICTHLPRKLRRLVYMSSILGLFTGRHPDMELVTKLNRILQLAKDPDAYKWSIQVNSFIWEGITGLNINGAVLPFNVTSLRTLDDEDFRRVGCELSKRAPAWIRYGSDDLMATDATAVMMNLRALAIR